jgi:hypothetical protein
MLTRTIQQFLGVAPSLSSFFAMLTPINRSDKDEAVPAKS